MTSEPLVIVGNLHVIYDPSSGRIVGSYHGPEEEADWQRQHWPGMEFLSTDLSAVDPANQMVSEAVGGAAMIRPRPTIPAFNKTEIAANGTDTARIKRLPFGITVLIDDQPYTLTDDVLEITATMPATYHVVIDVWPYRRYAATITAA
jgi:hypothetical protein